MGLACAPEVGTEIDFTTAAYEKSQSVVQAAVFGHCSVAEATRVLAQRLDDTNDAVQISKIKGAMDSLKLVSESIVSSATGAYMFIWTKISTVLEKRGDGVSRIELNSEKGKAQALTATLARPRDSGGLFEMTHFFIMVITGLGVASYMIVAKFCDDVVFGALRMGESWQVAFELMCVYLKMIDGDTTRTLTLGNVFRRGGQDTLLAEARRNAAAFFRTRGGDPRGEGSPSDDKLDKDPKVKDIKPNGKFDANAKKCCVDFNLGRPCKRLNQDGSCKFNHRCNQFVSDKGPGGVCFGSHARCHGCDYDDDKKLSKPLA